MVDSLRYDVVCPTNYSLLGVKGLREIVFLKAFLATFGFPPSFCKRYFVSKIQYVNLSLWPRLMFFKLKITYIEIKWVGTGKE